MIVVVGLPAWSPEPEAGPVGRACTVALAAASAGARVELVGRAGDDAAGDALVLALASAGVGHAALLRDPVRVTPIVLRPAPEVGDAEASDEEPAPPVAAPTDAPVWPRLEPADVALGLRYLGAFGVLVVTDDVPADVLPAAAEAAEFAGAHLVLLLPPDAGSPGGVPADALLLAAPKDDDGPFAFVVGGYAAAVDAGTAPRQALLAAVAAGGWEAVEPSS